MQTISVRTTQNVFIQYPVASLGDRILAYLIDCLVIFAYVLVCALFLGVMRTESIVFIMAVILIPVILYHLLFEIFMDGQSPGKKQMNIKVIRTDGTPPTLGNYVIRWIIRFVDINLFSGAIAMIVIAAGGRGQRLGDVAAGTAVVKIVAQREVTAKEVFTLVENDYVPVFSQVLQLTDRDIEIIQQALTVYRDTGNAEPANRIGQKVETLLGIQTDMEAIAFLRQIIKDYTQLSAGK
jgi:uncharacterized RDD family membrane protein YckC